MYTSEEQHKMAITEEVGQAQTDAQSFTAPRRPHYPRGGGAIRGIHEKFAANPVTGLAQSRCHLQQIPAGRASSHSLPSLTTQPLAMDHLASAGISSFHESRAKRTEDLVPVLIQNAAKQWVREVQEPRTVNQVVYNLERYRSRIEGSFSRIERWTSQADPRQLLAINLEGQYHYSVR